MVLTSGTKGLPANARAMASSAPSAFFRAVEDVATDSAEGSGALCAAEQPRYFPLHLHHADVPFGQVVVEGDIEVIYESQSFLPVPVETFEQVPGLGLFPSPAFISGMGGACGQGIGGIAVVQDVLIAGLEDLELGFRQMIGDRPGLIRSPP